MKRKGKKRIGRRIFDVVVVMLFACVLVSGFPSNMERASADREYSDDGAVVDYSDKEIRTAYTAEISSAGLSVPDTPPAPPLEAVETVAGTSVKNIVTEKGFSVDDVTDEFGDETVLGAYFISNRQYSIEYYEYIDTDTARETYDLNVVSVKEMIPEPSESTEDGKHGYSVFENGEACYFTVFKENVFLYTEAAPEYREEIDTLFTEMGYK